MLRRIVLIIVCVLLSNSAYGMGEDQGEANQELTGGTISPAPGWVVELGWNDAQGHGHMCSASVLSEHFLLTAAHCANDSNQFGYKRVKISRANSSGQPESIYEGGAHFLVHRDYERGIPFDPEDDMALLRLRDGAIDLSLTGRAKLYIDYENPIWTRPEPRPFTFAGWGLTNTASHSDCAIWSGALRIANATGLRAASLYQKVMTSQQGTTHACPGDSGSPWLFSRSGDFFAFAVHSGHQLDESLRWVDRGTAIFPKLAWIYDASREPGCTQNECWEEYLSCQSMGRVDDIGFQQCFEIKRVTGKPPDPSTACPDGKHCCEPGDPGLHRCKRCIPNKNQCP